MTENQENLLVNIKEATESEQGYLLVSQKMSKPLVDEGLVEINPEINNGLNGFAKKIATRITEKGVGAVAETKSISYNETVEEVEPPEKETSQIKEQKLMVDFEIKKAETIPAIEKAPSKRQSAYPFDQMGVMEYFTVVGKDAVKKAQSAMGAANKRNSRPTGEMKPGRKVDENGEPVMIPVYEPIKRFTSRVRRDEEGNITEADFYREM